MERESGSRFLKARSPRTKALSVLCVSFSLRSPLSFSLYLSRAQAALQLCSREFSSDPCFLERDGGSERARSALPRSPSQENNGGERIQCFFSLRRATTGPKHHPLPEPASALCGKTLISGSAWLFFFERSSKKIQASRRSGEATERERAVLCNSFKKRQGARQRRASERRKKKKKERKKENPKKALRIPPAFSRVSCRYFDSRARSNLSCARWNEERDKRRGGSPGAAARMPPTKHRREERKRSEGSLYFLFLSLRKRIRTPTPCQVSFRSSFRAEAGTLECGIHTKREAETRGGRRGKPGRHRWRNEKKKKLDVSDGDGDEKRKSFIALASRAHPSGPSFAPSFRHRAAGTATGMSTSHLRVSDAGRGVNSPSEQEAKIRVSGANLFSVSIQKPPRARARGTLCAPSTTPRVKTTTYRGWRPSRRRRWLRRGRWPWRGA